MRKDQKFVDGCASIAEELELEGHPELATLCDKAAFWLQGGCDIKDNTINELIASCYDTLNESRKVKTDVGNFVTSLLQDIQNNVVEINASLTQKNRLSLKSVARLQAVALITSSLLRE